MQYVDLDTMEVCSQIYLVSIKRPGLIIKAKGISLTKYDLERLNADRLTKYKPEATPQGVPTGKAILLEGRYYREYRDFTPEEVEEDLKRDILEAKTLRDTQVSELVVTTASGLSFDGDETSQNRMTRAITASNPGDTTSWKMADNTIATVTYEDLKEALALAGAAQTALWF